MTGEPASKTVLTPATRLAWLRLIRSENVGPVTFRQLINRFGGAQAALDALPDLAGRGGSRKPVRIATREAIEDEMAAAERMGARFVCLGEPDYPPILRRVDGPPPVLAVMGSAAVFEKPTLAVVGARNASASGTKLTRMLVQDVGEAGYAVASGLARGIDTAAHEASLATGTVGVFAGGLDRPYPNENRPLMRRIVDGGGCLVSEMPFGWEPRAVDFPRRNRIVVGLASGVLVVEAATRSGSLISARLAGEMGRLVFAVPGSPLDPRCAGTNGLLKDGATLVTEASDILDAMKPLDERMGASVLREAPDGPLSDDEPAESDRDRVLEALGPTPTTLDDLLEHTRVGAATLQIVLLELDLAGRIERHAGGGISLLL